ncbi:hypothetical protein OIU78_003412, partial [Salix suchowensis]
MLLSSVFSAISFASSVPSKVVSVTSFSTSTSMLPFSVFSATSFASSVPSKVVSVSSLSFEADDFLILFFGGPLSFTGVTLAFSLILADLLGVSPEPQSNSDTAVPTRVCFEVLFQLSFARDFFPSWCSENNLTFLRGPTFLGYK